MNFLPGWSQFLGGADPGIIEQVSSATGTDGTATCPSVNAGDLILFLNRSSDPATYYRSTPTTAIPSDFTSISNISITGDRQIVSYKIANGTEGGSSLVGMSPDVHISETVCVTFRRTSAAAGANISGTVNGQLTTGNPTAQNNAASGGTSPLIVIGCYGATGAVNPRTFSPAKDGEVNNGTTLYLAWKIYNESPQDVSIDMDDEGTNYLQSFYVELT